MSSRDPWGVAAAARATAVLVVSTAIVFGIVACSSDDGGSDEAAVEMWFPPGSGLVTVASLTVRGGASNPSTIVAVRVNGVVATTTNGFAEWEAEISLAMGANPVIVESEDAGGQVDTVASLTITRTGFDLWQEVDTAALEPHAPRALVLEQERTLSFLDLETGARDLVSDGWAVPDPVLSDPLALAPDLAGNRVLFTKVLGYEVPRRGALYEIDLATGARTVISDEGIGSGTPLMFPHVLAIDHAHGRAVMLESLGDWDAPPPHVPAIVAVDLETGDRTVLSGDGIGAGIELSRPEDLALDPEGNIAYVFDAGLHALLSVDLATGARTVVASGPAVDDGVGFPNHGYMELDAANHRVLLSDADLGRLLTIDLSTGELTFVANIFLLDQTRGSGDFMFDAPRDRIIFHIGDAFMTLDLTTGERQRISNAYVGTGPAMDAPFGAALNRVGDRAYVALSQSIPSYSGGGVFEVDLTTGNRRAVTGFDRWTGLSPDASHSVILDEDNGRLLLGDFWRGQVLAVALETGKRAVLWDANAFFPDVNFVAITALALYGDELLVATRFNDGEDGALCAVALDSGAWRILPGLGDLRELVISSDDGLAFVVDAWGCSITAIDLATGTRHQFSPSSTPPGCYSAEVLAYDDVRDRLVVIFSYDVEGGSSAGRYVIDIATGDLTRIPQDVSTPAHTWSGLTLDRRGYLIGVDVDLHALLAIDTVSGQVIVLSR
jgi:DNA-binding beta-propeller fold protein YncE